MILANDLRKAVLQAAIQGRIVDQRREEGTGEELFAQIQARKAELIKQGTAKTEKPLPKISEDETPFDIPSTWKWVRLGDISQSIADGDHQPPPQTPSGVPFIVISNLSSGAIEFNGVRHVPKTYYDGLQPSRKPSPGDILFTVTGSYGIPVMVETEAEFCFQRHMALIKYLLVDGRYLLYALSTPVVHEQCRSVATGTAQKTVGITSLKKVMLPLPPLEEQKRISERLGRILPEIEGYASVEEELTDLRRAFPDDMRKSILQYAMQGKLVEQRPEEGTGDELYRQIQAEKNEHIKTGKTRKEKPLPGIADDEIPFDVPDSWVWVRFNELGETTGTDSFCDGPFGSNLKTIHHIDRPEVRIIQLSNIGEYGWRDDNVKYTSFKHLEEKIPRCEVFPGNLVIAKMMPAGRTIEVPDLGTRITLGSDAMKFVPHHLLNKQFLIWYMRSNVFLNQIYADVHGITRVRTTLKKIKSYLVPLPPLAEQQRIVDKLEQILPHIDDLKEDE